MENYKKIKPYNAFEIIDDYLDELDELGGIPDDVFNALERLRDFFNLGEYKNNEH